MAGFCRGDPFLHTLDDRGEHAFANCPKYAKPRGLNIVCCFVPIVPAFLRQRDNLANVCPVVPLSIVTLLRAAAVFVVAVCGYGTLGGVRWDRRGVIRRENVKGVLATGTSVGRCAVVADGSVAILVPVSVD